MKISILITNYNLENYISFALDSVLMQKGDFEYEILIGDDGSKDKSLEIIDSYIKKYPDKIYLFQMPRDEGISYNLVERSSANRINLLEHAKGEYICFLDGDDFYTDDRKLEKQLFELEHNKKLAAVTHNVVLYYGNAALFNSEIEGQHLSRARKKHVWSLKDYWPLEFIQANAMLFRNYYNQGNRKCSKSLKELLNNNPSLKNNFDDNNITFSFLQYGDMCYLPDVMVAYRQTENSSWNANNDLKKACSNLIGFSIEKLFSDKEYSFARHYKDFKCIWESKDSLTKEKCQPFYDTAKRYNINPALAIYEMRDVDSFALIYKRSKTAYYKAKFKRIILKLFKIY